MNGRSGWSSHSWLCVPGCCLLMLACTDYAGGGENSNANGNVNRYDLACSDCHGSADNPAPPRDTEGRTDTSEVTVGAHQQHLGASDWRREIQCDECHVVPTAINDEGHIDAEPAELTWGPLASADSAAPAWDRAAVTCAGVYCHGSTLLGPNSGGSVSRTPEWTSVDGTYNDCGTTCHTTPPGDSHPDSTACGTCHGEVIASFDAADPGASVWNDASLHINGVVNLSGGLSCTSCHGDPATSNPAPPVGTHGETSTADPAVGAHAQHLGASDWHRVVQCTDCHPMPTSTDHSNGQVDFTWGGPAAADGASPSYDGALVTCSGVYCHGTTLLGPNVGGSVSREPVWTTVDGTYDACGSTCHTTPPGGGHPASTACASCHGSVITSYDPANPGATVWADASRHIDGTVDFSGSITCTSCHGTGPSQINPPQGVDGETTTNTLAVGRHVEHLTASGTHVVIACTTCHVMPSGGDTSHAGGHQASADLETAGHHGDVTFAGAAVGMTWDVNATQGAGPVTARGTCVGACHSDGDGGPPNVVPYWAGGTWNAGACSNCHDYANLDTGRHNTHDGLACSDCHPPSNSGTHVNGQKDFTVTGVLDGVCGNGTLRCSGTCHSQTHSQECWNN
ncbi:MAG: CxxxxCH/CxxCH domain-containing protein [bacterium]